MTAFAFDVAMAALGANGPEDETLDWDTIVWPVHEERVRRLRGRIFKYGGWPAVAPVGVVSLVLLVVGSAVDAGSVGLCLGQGADAVEGVGQGGGPGPGSG